MPPRRRDSRPPPRSRRRRRSPARPRPRLRAAPAWGPAAPRGLGGGCERRQLEGRRQRAALEGKVFRTRDTRQDAFEKRRLVVEGDAAVADTMLVAALEAGALVSEQQRARR